MLFPKMTNAEYQSLGKFPKVVATYLLDYNGERIRKLPEGSEKHSRFDPRDIEVVVKKPYDVSKISLDTEEAPY